MRAKLPFPITPPPARADTNVSARKDNPRSADTAGLDFVRTIAAARIMMPASVVRLAAGRLGMSEAGQALALFAGANSIFQGERLLTTPNPAMAADDALRGQIGIA